MRTRSGAFGVVELSCSRPLTTFNRPVGHQWYPGWPWRRHGCPRAPPWVPSGLLITSHYEVILAPDQWGSTHLMLSLVVVTTLLSTTSQFVATFNIGLNLYNLGHHLYNLGCNLCKESRILYTRMARQKSKVKERLSTGNNTYDKTFWRWGKHDHRSMIVMMFKGSICNLIIHMLGSQDHSRSIQKMLRNPL